MMKLKKILASVCLAAVCILPISSFAANWKWVASTNQASYYIDITSVEIYNHGDGFDVNTKIQYIDGSYDINKIEFARHKKGYALAWCYLLKQSFNPVHSRTFYSNESRIFPVPWQPVLENSLEHKYLIAIQDK